MQDAELLSCEILHKANCYIAGASAAPVMEVVPFIMTHSKAGLSELEIIIGNSKGRSFQSF